MGQDGTGIQHPPYVPEIRDAATFSAYAHPIETAEKVWIVQARPFIGGGS
ncbi:MAG: hypothetical protein JXB05_04080 [Myxococcaceae bacterium]|nr:hypothetical protein [Myxococcaceae bacterium]